MKLLIGQDTELFLKKDSSFISAYGVIPGDKLNPFSVKKGAVQVDGMVLEFNTFPAKTFNQFYDNINTVLSRLQDLIPDDCEMVICPTAHFDTKYLDEQPEEAKRLGCDPDFNAYTRTENESPKQHPTLRTAAGHIHLGWTNGKNICDPSHISQCCELVKQLDIYLGLPSLFHDNNTERRQMYGKAGAFRPKPYGVEYRVLSNYWISKKEYTKHIFDSSHTAFREFLKDRGKNQISKLPFDIEAIINTNNIDLAQKVCDYMKIHI